MITIAIDYDGTITYDGPFPEKANIRDDAAYYIKQLYEDGYNLVLWTARKGKYYEECIETLKQVDLYKYFNFNYNKCGETGKIVADYYIDDRALFEKLDWLHIYRFIKTH